MGYRSGYGLGYASDYDDNDYTSGYSKGLSKGYGDQYSRGLGYRGPLIARGKEPSVLTKRGLTRAYYGYEYEEPESDNGELDEIDDIEVKTESNGSYGYSELNLDAPSFKKPSYESPKI